MERRGGGEWGRGGGGGGGGGGGSGDQFKEKAHVRMTQNYAMT